MKPVDKVLSKPGAMLEMSKIPWSAPECARLTSACERLKQAYGKVVELLFATGYLVTDAEYQKLKAATENARIDLEATRRQLERHTRT